LFKNSKTSSDFAINEILNKNENKFVNRLDNSDNNKIINFDRGFDIVTQKYFEDMIEKGIIDSYNTIKCSVEDAISIAVLIVTTECIVYKEIDYDRKIINIF